MKVFSIKRKVLAEHLDDLSQVNNVHTFIEFRRLQKHIGNFLSIIVLMNSIFGWLEAVRLSMNMLPKFQMN
tara:strand:- start:295 stop:507 length:213 start_codon:yes stop_codon:yes gene_type:complete